MSVLSLQLHFFFLCCCWYVRSPFTMAGPIRLSARRMRVSAVARSSSLVSSSTGRSLKLSTSGNSSRARISKSPSATASQRSCSNLLLLPRDLDPLGTSGPLAFFFGGFLPALITVIVHTPSDPSPSFQSSLPLSDSWYVDV